MKSHEGRTHRWKELNVGSARFHEGRGAGKKDHLGGSRKEFLRKKFSEKNGYEKRKVMVQALSGRAFLDPFGPERADFDSSRRRYAMAVSSLVRDWGSTL